MLDVKCKNCNRLLAKANVMVAAIKCPRCKMIFEYKVYTDLSYIKSNTEVILETKSL